MYVGYVCFYELQKLSVTNVFFLMYQTKLTEILDTEKRCCDSTSRPALTRHLLLVTFQVNW